jgi:hypothetical protein
MPNTPHERAETRFIIEQLQEVYETLPAQGIFFAGFIQYRATPATRQAIQELMRQWQGVSHDSAA